MLAASLLGSEPYFCWGGLVLLLVPIFATPGQRLPINALSVGVILFCALLLANALLYSPHYSVYGVYRPVVLFGGFAAAAMLDGEGRERLLRAGTALFSLLVLFGLLQVLSGFWPYELDAARAAASFATPNTFATAINLILLPLLALALAARGGPWIRAATFWLFAGLMSTESRGGWIAFLAGLLFIVHFLGLPKARAERLRWLGIAAGLAATACLYYAMKALVPLLAQTPARGSLLGLVVEDMVGRGTSYRLDIAAVTLGQIAEHPLAGAGANTFWPLYEMAKPPELDMGSTFPFAHNDYLQTWLEYGLAGIVLLVALAAIAAGIALKERRGRVADPVPLACGAALAGAFVQALVDFPLYVPFPVTVLGAWLGVLAAHAGDARWAVNWAGRLRERIGILKTPLLSGAIAVAAFIWLAQPVIAYFADRHALAELFAGRPREALYWQSVARRMEPLSGMRYWEEGVTWRDQALAAGNRDFAARADAMFAEGMRADPYDVNNFVERAQLQRQHPELFERPAPPAQILEWSARAMKLRPYQLSVRADYALSLARAGRGAEAMRIARALVSEHPESRLARRLAEEL